MRIDRGTTFDTQPGLSALLHSLFVSQGMGDWKRWLQKLYTFCDSLRSLETRVAVSGGYHLLEKARNNFSSPWIVMYFALLPCQACFRCRLRLHKSRKSEQVWRASMERKDFAATQPWQLKLTIFAVTSHPLTTTSSFSTTTNPYSCSKWSTSFQKNRWLCQRMSRYTSDRG